MLHPEAAVLGYPTRAHFSLGPSFMGTDPRWRKNCPMGFWFSSSGPFTFEWDNMAPTLGSSVSPPGLLSPPAPTESDALG